MLCQWDLSFFENQLNCCEERNFDGGNNNNNNNNNNAWLKKKEKASLLIDIAISDYLNINTKKPKN